jgi:hypothetical protein
MFELIHDAGTLMQAVEAWFLAQPLVLQVLVGAAALAVLWVLWVVLRVFLLALRATFRGL